MAIDLLKLTICGKLPRTLTEDLQLKLVQLSESTVPPEKTVLALNMVTIYYGYNLSYQGSNGGFNGFLYLDNYHDFMNCYVDITANPACEAISITYTSVAVEQCDSRIGYGNGVWEDVPSCECDRFWISNENKKFPKQCGCNGAGCDDILWARNVTHPISGEEDYYAYYYEDEYMNEDGTYNLTAIYDNTATLGVNTEGMVNGETSQVVLGNTFR